VSPRLTGSSAWAPSCPLSPGSVLLSQESALQVSSALEVLTVVFGMGTRVSPPPSPPDYPVVLSLLAAVPQKPDNELLCSYSTRNCLFAIGTLLRFGAFGFCFAKPFRASRETFRFALGEALDRFVSVCSTCHHASTPDRSTLSSSRGLTPLTGWDTLS
jgi:hypothetical protein